MHAESVQARAVSASHSRAVIEAGLRRARVRRAETILVLGGMAAASAAIFLIDGALFPFITFPFVIWPAMRLGRTVTAVALVVQGAVATAGTLAGAGPFNALGQSTAEAGAELVGFLLTMTAVGLAVAAASERRRSAQDALARERDFVSTLLDSLADGVIACDAEGNLTRFNERAREIHGLPAEPVEADRWAEHYDIYHPGTGAHPSKEEIPLFRALQGEHVHDAEFDVAPKRGPRVTTSVNGGPIRDPDGELAGAVIVMRDITRRKQVEAALLEAEQRWRKTFSESPVAMALVSPDLRLAEVNEAFSELTGYSAHELSEMTFADITHPADVSLDVDLAERVFNGQLPRYDIEKRYITKNRRLVWVSVTASVIRNVDGTPIYGIGVVQDLSERKRVEERLRHLADHDGLTGLFNRRRLDEELERATASSRRYERPAALLIVDLDDFKRINDTLGHKAGDALLRQIATAMQRRLRASDVLARMGGDEFAVILPEVDVAEARAVADALRETIHRERARGSDLRATASVGIALLPVGSAKDAGGLLVEADLALYAAKHGGRNMCFVYNSALERT
jgi:diguanylate cyclase (GGDEF)-like protein/PAS domain S-box-containing protein